MALIVYKDQDLKGKSRTIRNSLDYLGDEWNDSISSVEVDADETWYLFKDHNYLGEMYGPFTKGKYTKVANDTISSVKLVPKGTVPEEKPSDSKSGLDNIKDEISEKISDVGAFIEKNGPLAFLEKLDNKVKKTVMFIIIITVVLLVLAVVGLVLYLRWAYKHKEENLAFAQKAQMGQAQVQTEPARIILDTKGGEQFGKEAGHETPHAIAGALTGGTSEIGRGASMFGKGA